MTAESIPSTANASYIPIVGGVIRGLLQIASAFGFTWALAVTGDQATMVATAVVGIATLLWSAWQKIASIRASRRAQVAAAVASAAATMAANQLTPVTVIETPPGEPNVAVPVSRSEELGAPIVPIPRRSPRPAA